MDEHRLDRLLEDMAVVIELHESRLDRMGADIAALHRDIHELERFLRHWLVVKSSTTHVVWIIGTPSPLTPGPDGPTSPQENLMANAPVNLPDNAQVTLQALFQDPLGNPQAVTNAALVVDNTSIGALTVNAPADPTAPVTSISGTLAAVGALGTCNVICTATDPDGNPISSSQAFSVISSGTTNVVWVIGTPTLIPPPTGATT